MLDYQLLNHSLIVAIVLFALGVVGFVTRRNLMTMLISSAVTLQGVVLACSAFSTFHAGPAGDLFSVVVVITIGVQLLIGLSMMIAFVRSERSLDVARWNLLGEGRAIDEASIAEAEHSKTRGAQVAGSPHASTATLATEGAGRGADN